MAVVDKIQMPNVSEVYHIRDNNIYTLLAPEYNSSSTYSSGDYCIHDYALYKCNDTTTGDWDSSKWDQTTIMDELKN